MYELKPKEHLNLFAWKYVLTLENANYYIIDKCLIGKISEIASLVSVLFFEVAPFCQK